MAPFWHRWSYFSIINLSVFHLADKCFAIANLINLRIILFLEYRKTPETQGFWGILRLDTECTPDTQFISSYNYSMIVATRPDPTVRPPSRFVGYIILLLLGVFQTLFYLYYFKFSLIFEVLIFFRTIVEPRMHKLCFYNYSKPLDLLEYTISNNSPVVSKALNLASKSSSSVFTTALTLSGFS